MLKKMIDWVKGFFFAKTIEAKKPRTILAIIDGERKTVVIEGTAGLHLTVRHGDDYRLLASWNAVNYDEFWIALKAWSPGEITFEDGSPFKL